MKSKVIRGNNKPFVTKTLRKAITRISALKQKANNLNDPLAIKLYKKQRNYVVNLCRKVKKICFQKYMPYSSSSNTNQITNFDDKIMLVENEKVVSKNEEIAYLFNTYFNDITKGLNIERWPISSLPCKDPLVNAIRKYEMHPNILKIKSVFKSIRLFDFNFVSSDDISKIVTSLDSTKKTSGVIPTKIVKLANKEIFMDLANSINESNKKNEFPNELKAVDITPTFSKRGSTKQRKL